MKRGREGGDKRERGGGGHPFFPSCLLPLLCVLAACTPPPAALPPSSAALPSPDTLRATPLGPALADARALAIDPSGRLYVADAGRDVVLELSPDGRLLGTLGGPGAGDHALLDPAGLDPTNGLVLLVADAGNGRIQRFSRERHLLDSLPVPADPDAVLAGRAATDRRGRPVAVASAPTGELYAAEALSGTVLRWDDRRALERVVGGPEAGRGALREPVALALAPDGRLFVADRAHAAVLVYDAYGAFLRRIGDGVAVGVRSVSVGRGGVLVTLEDAVLVYGLDGALLRAVTAALPEPLVAAVAEEGGGLIVLTPSRLYRLAP